MEIIDYIGGEIEKINPHLIFSNLEKSVIINYRNVTSFEINRSEIKIKGVRLLYYIEILIENEWRYEIEFGMRTLYLWKNTNIMCSKEIERLELIKNDNGNIDKIIII